MSLVLTTLDKEYEKDPEIKPEAVRRLSEWNDEQKHLPKLTDLELILFLKPCLYDEELAKKRIENFCTIRTNCPEIFWNKDPRTAAINRACNTVLFTVLPGSTDEGYKIVYIKVIDKNTKKFVHCDILKILTMVTDLYFYYEGNVKGHVFVIDFDGVSMGHMLRMKIKATMNIVKYIEEGAPANIVSLHIINSNWLVNALITLVRPFSKSAILDRLQFCNAPDENFFKHVPKKCMPNEYGGEAGTLEELKEKVIKDLTAHVDFFLDDEKRRVDETKRKS